MLSVKPSLLSFLPKPGAWMETFKQFMAFPMWASAIWLAWILSSQVGNNELMLAIFGSLLIAASLWTLDKSKLLAVVFLIVSFGMRFLAGFITKLPMSNIISSNISLH